jgi:hypothetical protein
MPRFPRLAAAAALALGWPLLPAAAQQVLAPDGTARGAIVADHRGIVLPAGDITAIDLIDATARFLCRNYVFDLAQLENVAPFTLQRPLALDVLGCEEVLYALLAARGFAVLPIDELRGVFEVITLSPEQRRLPVTSVPWRTAEDVLRRRHLRELVSTAIEVPHLDAQQLANGLRTHFALQGMWQPGMPTAAAAGEHMLLLHGFRDQVAETIVVVLQMDRLAAAAGSPTPDPATAAMLRRLAALEQEVATLRRELARRDEATAAPAATGR